MTDEERKARQRQQQADWYTRNKTQLNERMTANYRANRKARIAAVQNRYFGIADYATKRVELWTAQQGRCAVCGCLVGLEKVKGGLPVAHLDHDHETGKLRDILCPQCNAALGCFNDDTDLMYKAIAYLQRHRC